MMIPAASFIRVLDEDSPNSLESTIIKTQQRYRPHLEQLESQGITYRITTSSDEWWKDQQKDRLTIPPDDTLKQLILRTWHSSIVGGHLGQDETTRRITNHYLLRLGAQKSIARYCYPCKGRPCFRIRFDGLL